MFKMNHKINNLTKFTSNYNFPNVIIELIWFKNYKWRVKLKYHQN